MPPRKKAKKVSKKEKVSEYFEVKSPKGKEKGIKSEGYESQDLGGSKKQILAENKILRNIFIGMGVFVLILLLGKWYLGTIPIFEHEGVTYEIVKEGNLILYKTQFPVEYDNGKDAVYNIFLRNDPRKLEDIPFDGKIEFKTNTVINSTGNLDCQGDGIISVANLAKIKIFGTTFFKDATATCDPEGRYTYISLQESNETSVRQIGNSCYEINIKDCEILKGTERFMIESFEEFKLIEKSLDYKIVLSSNE